MTSAADILKQRAQMSEEHIAAYGICSPDELRAVAELMERMDRVARDTTMWPSSTMWARREIVESLAALERAITGENDAKGK